MRLWRYARTAAQHHLARHEFSVILAQCSGQGVKAGISEVRAGGPFPNISKGLLHTLMARICDGWMQRPGLKHISLHILWGCGHFPFGFSGQPLPCPSCISISLKVADVTYRRVCDIGQSDIAAQGKDAPFVSFFMPVQRSAPSLRLHSLPAF